MASFGHDGPDPQISWVFKKDNVADSVLKSDLGPNLKLNGEPQFEALQNLTYVRLSGAGDYFDAAGCR